MVIPGLARVLVFRILNKYLMLLASPVISRFSSNKTFNIFQYGNFDGHSSMGIRGKYYCEIIVWTLSRTLMVWRRYVWPWSLPCCNEFETDQQFQQKRSLRRSYLRLELHIRHYACFNPNMRTRISSERRAHKDIIVAGRIESTRVSKATRESLHLVDSCRFSFSFIALFVYI